MISINTKNKKMKTVVYGNTVLLNRCFLVNKKGGML